uniref:Uncharacterized protein n=1 Tax=Vitis vinifera TaxID=29760 RepID=F6I7B4_VITVI
MVRLVPHHWDVILGRPRFYLSLFFATLASKLSLDRTLDDIPTIRKQRKK